MKSVSRSVNQLFAEVKAQKKYWKGAEEFALSERFRVQPIRSLKKWESLVTGEKSLNMKHNKAAFTIQECYRHCLGDYDRHRDLYMEYVAPSM